MVNKKSRKRKLLGMNREHGGAVPFRREVGTPSSAVHRGMMSHVEYGGGLLCDIPSIGRPVPVFNFHGPPWGVAIWGSGQ
jgi:hypothetical protein